MGINVMEYLKEKAMASQKAIKSTVSEEDKVMAEIDQEEEQAELSMRFGGAY